MTSTISWSLIWSVYEDFPYFGNGLMYAMRPWSNYYEINQAIWTSAHHTQFMDPGWLYVGGDGGRGNLVHGGSWVSLVSPPQEKQQQDVTIVIEKLHGKCLRCPGQSTEKESFIFILAPSLTINRSSLSFWMTNQTVSFHRLPDVSIDPVTGSVTIDVEPDTIYTVSSLRGQTKGIPLHEIPKDVPFSLPHLENFESRPVASIPKYFSDNGGSFEIAAEEGLVVRSAAKFEAGSTRGGKSISSTNQYLRQMVHPPPIKNAWIVDQEAITLIGETTQMWSNNIKVMFDMRLPVSPAAALSSAAPSSAGGCLHVQGGGFSVGFSGHCVRLARGKDATLTWTLTSNKTDVLLQGPVPSVPKRGEERGGGGGSGWYNVGISFATPTLSVWLEGHVVGSVNVTDMSLTNGGRPALVSGWNDAHFDNFIASSITKRNA